MTTEKDKWPHSLLTSEEHEFLLSIKRDYEKTRWIRMSGLLAILIGIGIGVSPYISDASDVNLMVGFFFACLGFLTLRDAARTQKLYEILRKFIPSNMEL